MERKSFNRKRVGLFFMAAALLVLLSGCDTLLGLFGEKVSIEERIELFIDDLNSNRSNAYTHLHADCDDKAGLQDGAGWSDVGFAEATNYAISGLTVSGSTAIGSLSGGSFANEAFTFTMKEDTSGSGNWFILEISGGGVSIY